MRPTVDQGVSDGGTPRKILSPPNLCEKLFACGRVTATHHHPQQEQDASLHFGLVKGMLLAVRSLAEGVAARQAPSTCDVQACDCSRALCTPRSLQ